MFQVIPLLMAGWLLVGNGVCMDLSGANLRDDFETSEPGKAPAGYQVGRTGSGRPGRWVIRAVQDAPSGHQVLVQEDADDTNYRFPVAIIEGFTAADLVLSVRFRPISGSVDQAAGLVWRFRDTENYYVVRANALENNVVLYKVEGGRRRDLKPVGADRSAYGKRVQIESGHWSQLEVRAQGTRLQVRLNGSALFEVVDETFTTEGQVGLWTKADSVTQFDDLRVESLDSAAPIR